MANETHILLALQGGYTISGLTEETWQIGLRWRLSATTADAVGTLPQGLDVVANTQHVDKTDYTVDSNWDIDSAGFFSWSPVTWLDSVLSTTVPPLFAHGFFAAGVQLQRVKVYPIGPDGKARPAVPYAVGSPAVLTYKATKEPTGTGTGGNVPLQIATVGSLRTAQTGPRGRGRVYLPASPKSQLDSSGRWSSSLQTNLSTKLATFLEDSSEADAGPPSRYLQPIVTGGNMQASPARPWTDYAKVTAVRVGNVPDTQRRRRRSLVETYEQVSVTT